MIIHCNSGKGRTGTIICALLRYCGFFDNPDDTLRFYAHRRFSDRTGVTQPCQLRSLFYYESFYNGNIVSPCVKRLCKIEMNRVPKFSGDGCFPTFKVYLTFDKPLDPTLVFHYPPAHPYHQKKDSKIDLLLSETQMMRFTLFGDVKITVDHLGFSSE